MNTPEFAPLGDGNKYLFDPQHEKENYVAGASERQVWADGYFRLASFVADAQAIGLGPATIFRGNAGKGQVTLDLHATKHLFHIFFSSSSSGQRIEVTAEPMDENLHGLIPVYEGFEGPRGWSKTLREIARFEGLSYYDSFAIEEELWENEREKRKRRGESNY